MKAWKVESSDYSYSTVVFAETRGKARSIAAETDCCEDMDFIEISPIRFPEADCMHKGRKEMNWEDDDDRYFLVEHGWSCEYPEYSDCEKCTAKKICSAAAEGWEAEQ